MKTDTFEVACCECGQTVAVRSVSEFHGATGTFGGYSYLINCQCGSRTAVDGVDGAEIPDSMKEAAALRWRAARIRSDIDTDRRSLPNSQTTR